MNQPFGLATNGRDAADRIRQEGMMTDYRTQDAATTQLKMREDDSRLRPVYMHPARGPTHYQEMLRCYARMELTDGLLLSHALLDLESRLARDTSLLFILQQCTESTAQVINGFSRRGWAVSVLVNTYDINDFSRVAGPLIAGGCDVLHLKDENSVASICQSLLVR